MSIINSFMKSAELDLPCLWQNRNFHGILKTSLKDKSNKNFIRLYTESRKCNEHFNFLAEILHFWFWTLKSLMKISSSNCGTEPTLESLLTEVPTDGLRLWRKIPTLKTKVFLTWFQETWIPFLKTSLSTTNPSAKSLKRQIKISRILPRLCELLRQSKSKSIIS